MVFEISDATVLMERGANPILKSQEVWFYWKQIENANKSLHLKVKEIKELHFILVLYCNFMTENEIVLMKSNDTNWALH